MIVLDASVAIKLVFPEQHSDRALALLTATIQAGDAVLAPPLLPFEVAPAIRQRMIRQGLALRRADQIMTRLRSGPGRATIAVRTRPVPAEGEARWQSRFTVGGPPD